MEYELIRRRIEDIIPLNRLLGIQIVSIAEGIAEARLPFRKDIANHLGSVHATAIFSVAEAASGGAVAGAFAHEISKLRLVAVAGEVRFNKVSRLALIAHAAVKDLLRALRGCLAGAGKIEIDVSVAVCDEIGTDIAATQVKAAIGQRRRALT